MRGVVALYATRLSAYRLHRLRFRGQVPWRLSRGGACLPWFAARAGSRLLLREADGPSLDLTIRLKTCYLLQFRNRSGSVVYIRVAIPSGEPHRVGIPGGWLDMSSYPFHPFHARYLTIRGRSGKDRYVWDSETEEIVSFAGFTVRNACGNDVFLLADREGNLFVRRPDGLPPEAVNGIPVTHWKLSDDRRELVVDYRGVQKRIALLSVTGH